MREYIMRYEDDVLQLLPDKIQPLIRCKDCKHIVTPIVAHGSWMCAITATLVQEDHYCSYGVRKEGDGE